MSIETIEKISKNVKITIQFVPKINSYEICLREYGDIIARRVTKKHSEVEALVKELRVIGYGI